MCMTTQADRAQQFLALHRPGEPLLMPNPWDLGSARLLASLGFAALATTSSGFAATLGRNDGSVTRVEDFTRGSDEPIYDIRFAAERVAAAAEAAHAGPGRLVLTARAENYLHGRPDLADTIARLQAYQEAGADVLYAPGLRSFEDISQLVREVDRPVNVLALDGVPPVPDLAKAGVSRISVGGSFAFAALGAVVSAATELREQGTYGFRAGSATGAAAARRAFS
jgi:2-methylisocitrate lyase-like PEP mutase family enzyme